MSLRDLPTFQPQARAASGRGHDWSLREDALESWNANIRAAEDDGPTISILDVIGETLFADGVTSRRVSAALRNIGERDVRVDINSPGGDVFEGVAIYNLLAQHRGKVTVRILGIAASAASIIAMAGDEVLIGRAAFVMVHNAWGATVGNRHDHQDSINVLTEIDATMAGVYAARTGMEQSAAARLMDEETYMGGATAVERGFADGLLGDGAAVEEETGARAGLRAERMMENAIQIAHPQMSRRERRALLSDFKAGTPRAAEPAMRDAGDLSQAFAGLIDTLK